MCDELGSVDKALLLLTEILAVPLRKFCHVNTQFFCGTYFLLGRVTDFSNRGRAWIEEEEPKLTISGMKEKKTTRKENYTSILHEHRCKSHNKMLVIKFNNI